MKFTKLTILPIILAVIGIIAFSPTVSAGTIDSPLKQFSMGTAAEDILCKEGLQLMIRSSGEPACVKQESTTRLVDSNWGTIVKSMKTVDSSTSHQGDKDMMMKQEKTRDQEMKHNQEMKQIDEIDVSMSPPIEGSEDAPITIIEFGDFQCPKCDQWFQNEKPIITENYIDTGKANLYFIDFPFLGNDSVSAANASYCADEQGKYWEYHTTLYNNQGGINEGWASPAALKAFAITVGLNQNQFTNCLESVKYADRISYNKQVGLDHSIEGTPVFFIIDSNGAHKKIEGPQPASIFADTIDFMLNDGATDMSDTTTETETTMSEETITSIGGIDISMAAPIEGSEDAPYTIIEFGDFQCPKCDQWFQNEKPNIVTDLILTDMAKLYFVDFTFLGNDSVSAANASYCADEQGKYWEYHTTLYNNQGGIEEGWASVNNLKGFAVELGLDAVTFDECLDSEKYNDKIAHNKQVGISHGVEGTPAFFIVSPDGTIERIDGPQPASTFTDIIG